MSTQRTARSRRLRGYIVHVGRSRSARFWAAIKTADGLVYFAYGDSFVTPRRPRVGQRVRFTPLPAARHRGRMPRATEVERCLGERLKPV